jgi:hypothetical protein
MHLFNVLYGNYDQLTQWRVHFKVFFEGYLANLLMTSTSQT